jgi:hypothetical protein
MACATTLSSLSQTDRDEITTRLYNKPDSTLFSAITNYLVDKGYPIQVSDRATGLIQSDYSTEVEHFLGIFITGNEERSRIGARITNGEVRLNIVLEERYGEHHDEWHPVINDASDARVAYNEVFKGIENWLTR